MQIGVDSVHATDGWRIEMLVKLGTDEAKWLLGGSSTVFRLIGAKSRRLRQDGTSAPDRQQILADHPGIVR